MTTAVSSVFKTYRKQGDIFTFLDKVPTIRDAQISLGVLFAKELKSMQLNATPVYSPTSPIGNGENFIVQKRGTDGKSIDVWDEYKNVVCKVPAGWILSEVITYEPVYVAEYGIIQVSEPMVVTAMLTSEPVTVTTPTPTVPTIIPSTTPTPTTSPLIITPIFVPIPSPISTPVLTRVPSPVPAPPAPVPTVSVSDPTPTPTPTPVAITPTPIPVVKAQVSSPIIATSTSTFAPRPSPPTPLPHINAMPGYITPTFVFTKPIDTAPVATETNYSLSQIKSIYATESKVCMPYPEACKVGNAIRFTLSLEDNKNLLSWCMAKYKETRRPDIANLIGYINRWVLKDPVIAETFFRYAANSKYPLAMSNLIYMNVPDRASWEVSLLNSGYKC